MVHRLRQTQLRGVIRIAVAAAIAVATVATSLGAARAAPSGKLAPPVGALVGIAPGWRDGRNPQQEMEYLEQKIGRRFAIDHRYYRWDASFPGAVESWTLAAGRLPLLAWVPRKVDGTWFPWHDIVVGKYDSLIHQRARALRDLGKPIMLTFQHEPDTSNYPASDFVAAWRRIVDIFRAEGATNVVWVWNLMAYTFLDGGRSPEPYWPGDTYVDWIAADGYNWYGSKSNPGPWRTLTQIFGSWYSWSKSRGKPLMIAETGVLEDTTTPDPLRKANWFRDAAATLKTWPEVKAFVYFNPFGWHFDSSAASTAAFKDLANDPYFNVSPSPLDAASPTVKITSPAGGASVNRGTTVRITATAADDVAVTKVEFRVNGTVRCTDTAAPYSCDWTVWTSSGTTNWIRATAYDGAGKTASDTIQVRTS